MSHDAFEAEFMDCTIWTESKFLYFKKTVMKKKILCTSSYMNMCFELHDMLVPELISNNCSFKTVIIHSEVLI